MVRWTEAEYAEWLKSNGTPGMVSKEDVSDPPFLLPKGDLKPLKCNKTEARYGERLESLRRAGEVVWYRFEGITLKLADDTRYTADWAVMFSNSVIELHEVKGARAIFRDDAKVKVKVAASQFPFPIKVVFPRKDGGWDIESY